MEGFLTFILLSVLIFYLLGMVGRWALLHWVRKKQREFENGNGSTYSRTYSWGSARARDRESGGRSARPEGEVSIQQTHASEKKVNKNIGDYVEYEEVDATERTEQCE